MIQEIRKENKDQIIRIETLNGLSVFAEQRAAEGVKDSEITMVRKTMKEMSAYWKLDIPKDWLQKFDQRMVQIEQGDEPRDISMTDKITTLFGLAGYSEEMMHTHGGEEEEKQREVQQIMQKIEQKWNI